MERARVDGMSIQDQDQGRTLLDEPDPRVPMPMNPTLVPLEPPKPAFQIEIVPHLIPLVSAHEEAGAEASASWRNWVGSL